jgi:subtilisin family serine protease
VLGGVAALALVATATAAAAVDSNNAVPAEYVPGEVIVRFKPGVRPAVGARLSLPGARLVELPDGEDVAAAVRRFERRPDVVSAQPNHVYHTAVTPSDPFFGALWGLSSIAAPQAWDLTTGSNAVRVAVVDTGMEYDHPDLAANVTAPGWDFYAGDPDPRDENGHGTHVAGTIGANGNNDLGVAGVNWRVGLVPVRVLGPAGSGTTATITAGFRYAVEHGAKVVNASLGGSNYDPLMAATIAAAPETLFVVAAGNGGRDRAADDNDLHLPVYPCNYASANLVCVAATDASDSLAPFSNYGATSVDVAAPGVGIWSTYPSAGYSDMDGTSMAAPHVAGVAALMLARNPALTLAQLRAALLGSVDVLASLQGKIASAGRVNARKALLAVGPAPSPPAPAPPAPPAPPPKTVAEAPVRKVALCHRGRTIKVRKALVRKHRRHGDKLGACKKKRRVGRA